MKNENDLRVIKTRANIRSAFMALMKEKSLTDINVKEICDRALCSRNTFYMHYPYKEAVLEELTEDCVDQIVSGTQAIVERFDDIDLNVVESYAEGIMLNAVGVMEQIRFLVNYGGGPTFAMRLAEAVTESFIRNTQSLRPEMASDQRLRFYFSYLAGGIVNAILFWQGMPDIDNEHMIVMFRKIHTAATQVSLEYMTTRK